MARLSELIAPSFYELYWDVSKQRHTRYKLYGGRGSTKSSFVSVMIPLGIMEDPEANAICYRKVGNTLEGSVYNQMLWALDALGVSHLWRVSKSPLRLTYKRSQNAPEQQIIFKGCDDPDKSKSIKARHGYFKYVWFEERAEFDGEEEERSILQSVLRGGEHYTVFYTWNPPKSINNWVNQDVLTNEDPDTVCHFSSYLTVPEGWLSEQFIADAEALKARNRQAYRHEYLGEAIGTGGKVFDNVTLRKITEEERGLFDRIRQGLDFGFAGDPLAFVRMHYDRKHQTLYLLDEVYAVELGNSRAVEMIRKADPQGLPITADSAEPRSIASFRELGLKIVGAKKGPGSVEHGIEFLARDLDEIVIDPETCPNAAREFAGYEMDRDRHGNFKGSYPDRDNHTIDAVRYAMEDVMTQRKARVKNKAKQGLR